MSNWTPEREQAARELLDDIGRIVYDPALDRLLRTFSDALDELARVRQELSRLEAIEYKDTILVKENAELRAEVERLKDRMAALFEGRFD